MSWFSRVFGKEKEPHPQPPARTAAPVRLAPEPTLPAPEETDVYTHPPFTEDVRDVLREIKMSLDEVYMLSVDEWEDRFRREPDTIKAIASYVVIARVYRQLTADGRHDKTKKRDLYHVLAACPLHSRDEVLMNVHLAELSREEANAAIEAYHSIGPQRQQHSGT